MRICEPEPAISNTCPTGANFSPDGAAFETGVSSVKLLTSLMNSLRFGRSSMRADAPMQTDLPRPYAGAVKIGLVALVRSRWPEALEPAPEGGGGCPAEAEGQRDGCKPIEQAVAAGGERNVALEAALVDLDVAGRGGDHLAVVDEEGLCSVGAYGDLAGDRDRRAVQDAVGDLDAPRVL